MITGGKDWGSASSCACHDQPLHMAGLHLVVVAGLHVAVDTGHHPDDHDDGNDYVRFSIGRGDVQNKK